MTDTAVSPDRIATVVESGNTDRINDLLDDLKSLDVPDQLGVLDDSYETLLDCMDLQDGYSRQAVVRIVSALDPGTGRMIVETAPDQFDTIPSDEQFTEALDRAGALFGAALTDDDGRVRRAAIRGLNSFAVGCRLTGDRERLEGLVADLDALSVGDERAEHVEEARDTVLGQFH